MTMPAAYRKVYTQGPEADDTPNAVPQPSSAMRAEQAVLGSMLIAKEAATVAVNMLMPQHFSSERHSWLFKSFCEVYHSSTTGLDEIVVVGHLMKRRMTPEQKAAVTLYLGEIQMKTPSASRIEQYCASVLDDYEQREVKNAVALLEKGIRDGHELRALIPQFIEATNAILVERVTKDESAAVDQEIKDEIEGRRFNVQIPGFRCLSTVKMFLPGCVVALVGSPGSGKSSMLLDWFWRWEFSNVRVACLMLESGAAFHLRRCLAQLAERTELLDDVWCKRNPDEAKALQAQWGAQKERIAKNGVIQAMPRGATCADLTRWMDREFRDARRILAIDPIAAMAGQEKRFLDQERLMGEAQNLAEKHKGTVLFSMHPKSLGRGERRRPSLDQLPGSADFQKFIDAGVWLSAHDPLEAEFAALDEYGRPLSDQVKASREYNRTLTVIKNRRAGGWMPVIAANMSSKTLWTQECGWL